MKPEEIKLAIQESLPQGEDIEQFIGKAFVGGKNIAAAITSDRIVICKKGVFKNSYEDHPWSSFSKVVLEEGPLKGTLFFNKHDGEDICLKSVNKESARRLCGYARTMIDKMSIKKILKGKTCPDCGELVKHIAKICPHCSHNF